MSTKKKSTVPHRRDWREEHSLLKTDVRDLIREFKVERREAKLDVKAAASVRDWEDAMRSEQVEETLGYIIMRLESIIS